VNAFHDEFHHLGAGDQRSGPANEGPLPGLRAALDEELRDDLLAAWRQQAREVGNHVEEVGAVADRAGGEANGDEQRGEKCQE
jgi:hypothetical protein